jgi:hypothetical protein
MALIDDLDGTRITEGRGEQIEFSLRGRRYVIDLAEYNVRRLESVLAPFIERAQPVGSDATRGHRASLPPRENGSTTTHHSVNDGGVPSGGGVDLADDPSVIRAWANRNGYEVGVRGRIPKRIARAFRQAQHAGH